MTQPESKTPITEAYFTKLLDDAGRSEPMPWQSIARLMFVYAKDQETALSEAQAEIERLKEQINNLVLAVDNWQSLVGQTDVEKRLKKLLKVATDAHADVLSNWIAAEAGRKAAEAQRDTAREEALEEAAKAVDQWASEFIIGACKGAIEAGATRVRSLKKP